MRERSPAVGRWLLVLAAFVVGQVLLGGLTRLTGSGLSITEWRPVTGVVPPLDDAEWERAFAQYRAIPQFEQVNPHFTRREFERIYFYEWLHRAWARLLAVAFVVPAAVLWRRGLLRGRLRGLGAVLLLGALQAALGWFMVVSGLHEGAYVSHLRLALHLLTAFALLGVMLWLAWRELWPPGTGRAALAPVALLGVLAVQLAYGAFMAGLRAAPAAPSWPTVNGVWWPRGAFESAAALVDDPLTVQVVHRSLGYLLAALVAAEALTRRQSGAPRAARYAPLAAVAVQLSLGVATVLAPGEPSRFIVLALLHQLGAVALFVALLASAWFARARADEPAPSVTRATFSS